ncbi:hypothetical protein Sme01_09630 [Sphaerisporangium melleum]|uniref:Secreted protein n=1 Tax=Sphaerisporangium melleum TaxID=321316 RepID=A0A917VET1_9ACTN|nr:hypothetical protein [Sphaerisporangium melleum]GGK67341.1 hypothetical protein GCM10007964_07980 [Sphaerisporangium melleum]GII68487.1 hypothetical protein Sme01_09630 [Sphaerisporangium melleum]
MTTLAVAMLLSLPVGAAYAASTPPGPRADAAPVAAATPKPGTGDPKPTAKEKLKPAPGIHIPSWHKPVKPPTSLDLKRKMRRGMPPEGIHSAIDSFAPLLFLQSGPNPGLQAWSIAHHAFAVPSAPKVTCINIADGTHCTNPEGGATTWPKPLSTQPGSLSTVPGDISTTQVPQYVINPLDTSLILYPAVTKTPFAGFPDGSVGVGCLLLAAQYNCGYHPLAPLTNNAGQSNTNGLTGFVQVGNELYGATTSGLELCYNS